MSHMRSSFLSRISLPAITLFMVMMFPVISMSAQAAITDAEYKALLGNNEFKISEESLGAIYKAYLAASKNESEKKEFIQGQRLWVKEREEEAAKRFKKGSPAYVQFLIDWTTHRVDTLRRIINGNPESIKADGYFDTLDYDKIPYDGTIKSEHRLSGNGDQTIVTERKEQKPSNEASVANSGKSTTGTLTMPVGFIALAPNAMNWNDAEAYCRSKGGTLPRINNRATFGEGGSRQTDNASIEGFGTVRSPWPFGLPQGDYWTGTAGGAMGQWVVRSVNSPPNINLTDHHPRARPLRAVCVEIGEDSKDLVKLQEAAEAGDANAQVKLAAMYAHGRGLVAKDVAKAAQLFYKAAEQGNAEAQYKLGDIYGNGIGVTQDATKAVQWFQKANEQGYPGAKAQLEFWQERAKGIFHCDEFKPQFAHGQFLIHLPSDDSVVKLLFDDETFTDWGIHPAGRLLMTRKLRELPSKMTIVQPSGRMCTWKRDRY